MTSRRTNFFSPEEDAVIKQYYRVASAKEIAKMLVGKSERGVQNRAFRLCLTKKNPEWSYSGMTEDIAYMLGVYLTDGCMTFDGKTGNLRFKLNVIDREFLEFVLDAYERTSGKVYNRVWELKKDKAHHSTKYAACMTCNDLNKWMYFETNSKTRLPQSIWGASKECKLAFSAGMLDGDGWVAKGKNNSKYTDKSWTQYRIGFCSQDEWIYDFGALLNGIGISTTKIQVFIDPRSEKPIYRFDIHKETYVSNGGYFRVERKWKRYVEYAESKLGISPQRLSVPPLRERKSQSELNSDIETSTEMMDAPEKSG